MYGGMMRLDGFCFSSMSKLEKNQHMSVRYCFLLPVTLLNLGPVKYLELHLSKATLFIPPDGIIVSV